MSRKDSPNGRLEAKDDSISKGIERLIKPELKAFSLINLKGAEKFPATFIHTIITRQSLTTLIDS
jgi:hypothetical protein